MRVVPCVSVAGAGPSHLPKREEIRPDDGPKLLRRCVMSASHDTAAAPPDRPSFKLVVVASLDGFIARGPGHPPSDWASAEEQELFFAEVDAADWTIMGRGTHEAADKPHRRRIVFSRRSEAGEWRRPTQFWADPASFGLAELARAVAPVHPCRQALILGGTGVHDWFHAQGCIDEVLLTIEPVRFGTGLPIFSGAEWVDPLEVFMCRGFEIRSEEILNSNGTRLISLGPQEPNQ